MLPAAMVTIRACCNLWEFEPAGSTDQMFWLHLGSLGLGEVMLADGHAQIKQAITKIIRQGGIGRCMPVG